jgi:hypothetical protein
MWRWRWRWSYFGSKLEGAQGGIGIGEQTLASGLRAAERARQHHQTRSAVVIAITAIIATVSLSPLPPLLLLLLLLALLVLRRWSIVVVVAAVFFAIVEDDGREPVARFFFDEETHGRAHLVVGGQREQEGVGAAHDGGAQLDHHVGGRCRGGRSEHWP